MIIVCTTDALNGTVIDVDREHASWFEKDYDIEGRYAVSIFPKNAWTKVGNIIH